MPRADVYASGLKRLQYPGKAFELPFREAAAPLVGDGEVAHNARRLDTGEGIELAGLCEKVLRGETAPAKSGLYLEMYLYAPALFDAAGVQLIEEPFIGTDGLDVMLHIKRGAAAYRRADHQHGASKTGGAQLEGLVGRGHGEITASGVCQRPHRWQQPHPVGVGLHNGDDLSAVDVPLYILVIFLYRFQIHLYPRGAKDRGHCLISLWKNTLLNV